MTDNANISKVNTYVVQQKQSADITKVNAYAVVQNQAAKASKVNTYVVQQEVYGVLYQDEPSKRPVYRSAPSGGIPYIDMSDTNAELKVNVPYEDNYTFIVYNADETFTTYVESLTQGENISPIVEDFNQCVVIRGNNIHRFVIDSIKEGMKARV